MRMFRRCCFPYIYCTLILVLFLPAVIELLTSKQCSLLCTCVSEGGHKVNFLVLLGVGMININGDFGKK